MKHASQPTSLASSSNWWKAYGPFEPGMDGFPHIGHVIRYYRELYKLKISDVAGVLGISASRMYEIEETITMPNSLSRRQALANTLNIPHALLNLPSSAYTSTHAMDSDELTHIHPLEFYQDVLTLSWDAYYTSTVQHSASIVKYCLQRLKQQIKTANGILQHQLIALLCRFLQLDSVIRRDHNDFCGAEHAINQAIKLAFRIQNSELITASLTRRARNYFVHERYDLAMQDLEATLPYASRSRDPLRCYASSFMAEVYSLFASDNAQLAQKSLKLLDQVGRTVRLYGVLEGDESFTKVDIPGLYMLRGDVLRRIGKIEEAQNALVIARDNLSPESTRWQGNLYTSEAQLAYTDKDIEGCCKLALDALNVVAVIKSQPNLTKIEHLYESLCKDLKVTKSHSSVKELGTRLVELFQT